MLLKTPKDQYINIGNVKTRYWSVGEKGSAVVLIHGLGASAEIWLRNINSLAKDHRVFILDLPGFGYSDRPGPDFTPLYYPGFLDNFLTAFNIEKATVIGQSLGGGIALLYALQFQQKVEKLILVDCAGFGKEVIWTLRLMSLPVIGEIISRPTRLSVSLFFRIAVRNKAVISKDFIDTYYQIFNQPGYQDFLLKITRMMVSLRSCKPEVLALVMDNLHKIRQPVLIIWGEDDRVFPLKHAYYSKKKMPNSKLYIMKQCGHIANLEKFEEFNRVVTDFLDT